MTSATSPTVEQSIAAFEAKLKAYMPMRKRINTCDAVITEYQDKLMRADFDPDRIAQQEKQFLLGVGSASRATATRDLTDLVKKGALVKSGELRYTRYRLNIPKTFAE